MKRKGFSLVEIMVGLGVIIALAAATFPTASAFLSLGRHSGVKTDVGALSAAVSQYVFEVGTYPPNLSALTQAVGQYGPWLSASSLKDQWGNDYNYSVDTANKKYAVWSNGPNKTNNSGGGVPASFSSDDVGFIGYYQ